MKIHLLTDSTNIYHKLKNLTGEANLIFEPIKTYSRFSIERYRTLFAKSDTVIRFESSGLPIPETLLGNLLKAWEDNRFYIKLSGQHILIDGLIAEIFGREAWECVRHQKHPLMPDGSLNSFADNRAKPYWLNMDEQRFYLLDHYDLLYTKPTAVNIETTPYCNLKCSKCQFHSPDSPYTTKANRKLPGKPMMTLHEWKRIIDKLYGISQGFCVSPAIRGECLLHKDIIPMIAYATRRGQNVSFYTNGNLLTEDRSKALIDAGLRSITFSLDAVNEEQYKKLQPGGDYKTVIRNIQTLLRIRRNRKVPKIGVSFCESFRNEKDFHEYFKFWSSRVDRVDLSVELDINKGHTAWKRYYAVPFRYPCTWLWRVLYIHSDGSVATCGLDMFQEHNLGNVFEEDILSIWNSKRFMELRRNQAGNKRDFKFCQGDFSWSGSYFIERIKKDSYERIGPIVHTYSSYTPRPQIYRFKSRIKRHLKNFEIPYKVTKKLYDIYQNT